MVFLCSFLGVCGCVCILLLENCLWPVFCCWKLSVAGLILIYSINLHLCIIRFHSFTFPSVPLPPIYSILPGNVGWEDALEWSCNLLAFFSLFRRAERIFSRQSKQIYSGGNENRLFWRNEKSITALEQGKKSEEVVFFRSKQIPISNR